MIKIWKPLSKRKPSTSSVRTRPPTASAASRRRKGILSDASRVAAAKPARPAPTMMTPVFELGGNLGLGESTDNCTARGLNVKARRSWERQRGSEGLGRGR